jgi:hypothetical protein
LIPLSDLRGVCGSARVLTSWVHLEVGDKDLEPKLTQRGSGRAHLRAWRRGRRHDGSGASCRYNTMGIGPILR